MEAQSHEAQFHESTVSNNKKHCMIDNSLLANSFARRLLSFHTVFFFSLFLFIFSVGLKECS